MYKIETKMTKINTVPERWAYQYSTECEEKSQFNIFYVIYCKLLNLKINDSLTEENIVNIIGNTSWTENICDECEKDKDKTIFFYEQSRYSLNICEECFSKISNDLLK